MELGEKKLVVQRASVGAHKHDHTAPSTMFMPMVVKEDDATRVVQLMNMVTPEELEDDDEYQGISITDGWDMDMDLGLTHDV